MDKEYIELEDRNRFFNEKTGENEQIYISPSQLGDEVRVYRNRTYWYTPTSELGPYKSLKDLESDLEKKRVRKDFIDFMRQQKVDIWDQGGA